MKKLFAIVLVSLTTTAQQDSTVMTRDQCGVQDSLRYYMLELVNEFRVMRHRKPLQYDSLLNTGAIDHLKYINDIGTITHEQKDKSSPYFTGKTPSKRCNKPAGENVAVAYTSTYQPIDMNLKQLATDLFENWKESPGHRANMLGFSYKKFGFAASMSIRTENKVEPFVHSHYFMERMGVQTFSYE